VIEEEGSIKEKNQERKRIKKGRGGKYTPISRRY